MTAAFVLGTAGHVDHGKTSLVRALTGVETDRLPEEKARGMSLELGFAPLALGPDEGSVIDVPGHEGLVRAMIRGASTIDAVLLAVAADEGVMPQTREHLAICELLGVRRLVVALTKADRADLDTRALVTSEVAELLQRSAFVGAPIVPCSVQTGFGLGALRAALAEAVTTVRPERSAASAFLPIDRVFSKAGFGTIVTGTLVRGSLAVGDEIDVLTARGVAQARVRGLQCHGRTLVREDGKARLAVALGSVPEAPLRYGALGARGSLRPTMRLVATLRPLPDAPAWPRRGRATLHLGAFATEASFSLLEPAADAGVGSVRAFLTLSRPLLAWTGDRFVLRRDAPLGPQTFGGGTVNDPHPTRSRRRLRLAPIPPDETTDARVERIVEEAGPLGCTREELSARGLPGEELGSALAACAIVVPGEPRRFVGLRAVEAVERALLARLDVLERAHPALASQPVAAVLAGTASPETASVALGRLLERGLVVREEGRLATRDRRVEGPGAIALRALEEVFRASGLTPPTDAEAIAQLGASPPRPNDLFAELRRRGVLVRVPPFHVHHAAAEALLVRVGTYFEGHASLGAAEMKTLGGGLSRKYAIPLLEWLDARGVTRRRGELHLPNVASSKPERLPR